MATVVHRFVNTASGGGDGTTRNTAGTTAAFASLSDAISAFQSYDLVSNNEILVINCEGSLPDTSPVVINSINSHLLNYVLIRSNPYSATGRARATSYDATKYRLEVSRQSTEDAIILIDQPHIRVAGIQVRNTYSAVSAPLIQANYTAGVHVEDNYLLADGSFATLSAKLKADAVGAYTYWAGNILDGAYCVFDGTASPSSTLYFYSNTVYNPIGFTALNIDSLRQASIRNNILLGRAITDRPAGDPTLWYDYRESNITLAVSASNNVTHDTSNPGGTTGIPQFTNSTTKPYDLSLKDTDTIARGAGGDLTTDPILPIIYDIQGVPWVAGFDVGASKQVTVRRRYVDTGSAGGDGTTAALTGANAAYSSLTAAIAAWNTYDAVANRSRVEIICAASFAATEQLSAALSLKIGTSDAAHYLTVRGSHPGFLTGTGYQYFRVLTTAANPLTIDSAYTRLEYAMVQNIDGADPLAPQYVVDIAATDCRIVGCILKGISWSQSRSLSINAANALVANTTCFGALQSIYLLATAAGARIMNNTMSGGQYGLLLHSGVPATGITIKNNMASGQSNACYQGVQGGHVTEANLSSDTTSPDGAAYQNKSYFPRSGVDLRYAVTPANNPFYGLAVDQSTDDDHGLRESYVQGYGYAADFEKEERVETWAPGADEPLVYRLIIPSAESAATIDTVPATVFDQSIRITKVQVKLQPLHRARL